MLWIGWLAIAAGFWPLYRAWQANRRTTLRDAILWAGAAWLSWGFAVADLDNADLAYLALSLTGCAGVAVLGARRPHVFAWNFVVLGLCFVMTLPVVEGIVIQVHSFNVERKVFLAGILIVALGNYAPTRFYAASLAAAVGCLLFYANIIGPSAFDALPLPVTSGMLGAIVVALVPWLAWMAGPPLGRTDLDRDWFAFRDRFGFVWGARVREQFNAAAKNAGIGVQLGWRGFVWSERIDEARSILKALTKRFDAEG